MQGLQLAQERRTVRRPIRRDRLDRGCQPLAPPVRADQEQKGGNTDLVRRVQVVACQHRLRLRLGLTDGRTDLLAEVRVAVQSGGQRSISLPDGGRPRCFMAKRSAGGTWLGTISRSASAA